MRLLLLLATVLAGACGPAPGRDDVDAAGPAGDATVTPDAAADASPPDAAADASLDAAAPGPWSAPAALEGEDGHDARGLVVAFAGDHGIAAWSMVPCAEACDGPDEPWLAIARDGAWSPGARVPGLARGRVAAVTADRDGGLLVLVVRDGALEAVRRAAGAWAPPVALTTAGTATIRGVRASAVHGGNAVAVWEVVDGERVTIHAAIARADGWTAAQRLDAGTGPALQPAVSLDATGVALVAWVQDGQLWTRRKTPATAWSAPEAHGPALGGAEVVQAGGAGHVVWRDADAVVHRRLLGPWSPPAAIDGGAGISSMRLSLAGDAPTGRVAATWLTGAADARNLYQSIYSPDTGWTPATALDVDGGAVECPSILLAGGDRALATWTQPSSATSPPSAWASRWDVESGWSPPEPLAAGPVTSISPYHDAARDRLGAVWLAPDAGRASVFHATRAAD